MKQLLLFLSLLVISQVVISQGGVSISNTLITPDPSAMLDVTANDKGLLIPRVALTATNVAAPITTPANSLLVYNTATAGVTPNNVTPGFYYWNASIPAWSRIVTGNIIGTDDQNIDSLRLNGNILTAYIESGGSANVDLSTLLSSTTTYTFVRDSLLKDTYYLDSLASLIGDSINTDNQNIDSLTLNGKTLNVYIENGNSANINLSNLILDIDTNQFDSLLLSRRDTLYSLISDSLLNDTSWLSQLKDSLDSDVDSAVMINDTTLAIYEDGKTILADLSILKDSNEWIDGAKVGLTPGAIYARKALANGDTVVIDTAGRLTIGFSDKAIGVPGQKFLVTNNNNPFNRPNYGDFDSIYSGVSYITNDNSTADAEQVAFQSEIVVKGTNVGEFYYGSVSAAETDTSVAVSEYISGSFGTSIFRGTGGGTGFGYNAWSQNSGISNNDTRIYGVGSRVVNDISGGKVSRMAMFNGGVISRGDTINELYGLRIVPYSGSYYTSKPIFTFGAYLDSLEADSIAYGVYQKSNTAINYFSGNTGIGTTTPTHKLDVNGEARIRTINDTNNATGILTANTNGVIQNLPVDSLASQLADSSEWIDGAKVDLTPGAIYARKALANGDTVVIDANGNYGLGTNTPTEKLHIEGGMMINKTGAPVTNGVQAAQYIAQDQNLTGTAVTTWTETNSVNSTASDLIYGNVTRTRLTGTGDANYLVGINPIASHEGSGNVGDQVTGLLSTARSRGTGNLKFLLSQNVQTEISGVGASNTDDVRNISSTMNLTNTNATIGEAMGYRSLIKFDGGSVSDMGLIDLELDYKTANAGNVSLNNFAYINVRNDTLPTVSGTAYFIKSLTILPSLFSGNIGIGAPTATNQLHIAGGTNPLRLEGLQAGAVTDSVLVADAAGVVKKVSSSQLSTANFTSQTANYSVANTINLIFVNSTSVAFDITLPSAITYAGRSIKIKRTDNSANNVTVKSLAGNVETNAPATGYIMGNAYETVNFVSDGTDWWIVD
jgi:hypothetical protein